jgi:hypothetical protein
MVEVHFRILTQDVLAIAGPPQSSQQGWLAYRSRIMAGRRGGDPAVDKHSIFPTTVASREVPLDTAQPCCTRPQVCLCIMQCMHLDAGVGLQTRTSTLACHRPCPCPCAESALQ